MTDDDIPALAKLGREYDEACDARDWLSADAIAALAHAEDVPGPGGKTSGFIEENCTSADLIRPNVHPQGSATDG